MNKILLYFLLKYNCNWDEIYAALDRRDPVTHSETKDVEKKVKSNYLSIIDDLYPSYLKKVYKPPFIIFYYGNIKILSRDIISFDGELTPFNEKYFKLLNHENNTILLNGDKTNTSTINKLLTLGYSVGVLFANIDCDKAIAIKTQMNSHENGNNCVLFSEKCFGNTPFDKDTEETFRMLFAVNQYLIFDESKKFTDADRIINFCRDENIKLLKIHDESKEEKHFEWKEAKIPLIKNAQEINLFFAIKC